MESANDNKGKTPIFCIKCKKESGYFLEDFVYKKVETPKLCNNCDSNVLDKPDFPEPLYN
jgi:flavoprotein